MIILRLSDYPILSEIKAAYIKYRESGISREEAVSRLCYDYAYEITQGQYDDAWMFWIGLADAQYSCKELSADVAKYGLEALASLERSTMHIPTVALHRRMERYALAPMQEQAAFQKNRKFRCQWNYGDTFAYLLSGPEADAMGINGKYILLRKVDEFEFGDGRLLPVVTFTMWDDLPLPKNSEEFQRIPALKLWCGRLGLPETQYEYRAELMVSSRKKLNSLSLVYLGNFQNIETPLDEVIVSNPGMVLMASPDRLYEFCRGTRYFKRPVGEK